MKKILWVNPSFLDYRVPVYKKLNDLTRGNFFLLYSKKRVPERVIKKIENAIGDNAIGLSNELTINIAGKGEFANTGYQLPFQAGLYKAISQVDADIIIAEGFFQWTPFALLYAKLCRKKILIAYERTTHTERNCPKWRTLYRKCISMLVDGFSVNGQLTKEYLIQLGVNEEKICIGGMSADSEKLVQCVASCCIEKKESLKSKLSLKKGLTYLYVGRVNQPKGVIFLLKGWKKHVEKYKNDSLLIVGPGPLYTQYTHDFSEYNSIKMVGSIDYDLIYQYYAIADVFIIPTLEDNWSLVVPEAMACGLPIACSIYNGCYPELVHEGINGKLFDPLKEQSIVEALDYFHNKNLDLFGKESKMIEKKYNADAVANKIYHSFEMFGN